MSERYTVFCFRANAASGADRQTDRQTDVWGRNT